MSHHRKSQQITFWCSFTFFFGTVASLFVKPTLSIPGHRKYLIVNESRSIQCHYETGKIPLSLRMDLYHYRDTQGTGLQVKNRQTVVCEPEMPKDLNECLNATKSGRCSIEISKAQISDSGIYNCELKDCKSLAQTDRIVVAIYESPILLPNAVEQSPASGDVPLNGSFSLLCHFTRPKGLKNNQLYIQWRLRSAIKDIESDLFEAANPYMFFLSNATKKDYGWYQCVITPKTFKDEKIQEFIDYRAVRKPINIQYPATIQNFSSSPFPADDKKVVKLPAGFVNNTLSCTADGNPVPLITLYFNGKKLPWLQNRYTVTHDLASVTEKDDDGEYCCSASNSLGAARNSCLSFSVYGVSSESLILETTIPLGLFSICVIFLLVAMVVFRWRKKRVDPERQRLLPDRPSQHLQRLVQIIASVPWIDVARTMEPAVDNTEIEAIAHNYENNVERGAAEFLIFWMRRNPENDVVHRVREALVYDDHHGVIRDLENAFPYLCVTQSWRDERRTPGVV
eukprot:m.253080 g.253080  ORF g.253080 m.253080 type:complete len:511 (+) comp40364_c2_seq14:121-1653(+)